MRQITDYFCTYIHESHWLVNQMYEIHYSNILLHPLHAVCNVCVYVGHFSRSQYKYNVHSIVLSAFFSSFSPTTHKSPRIQEEKYNPYSLFIFWSSFPFDLRICKRQFNFQEIYGLHHFKSTQLVK